MDQIAPYLFDEFFASGLEESISPFLTPKSRKWGKNLPLKNAFLAAFLLLLSFILSFFSPPTSHLCLTAVYFFAGTPALLNSLEDLRNMEINIDVLMTLAALLSIAIGSGLEGALLLVLFELSAAMENMVTEKTKSSLISLRQLAPKFAIVIEKDNTYFEKSVHEIAVNTPILIKAGEVVPLDGQVIGGSSYINLIHLTGESQPIAKHIGDEVPAGALNLDGTLSVKVTRTSSDSTLSRIISLIIQAQIAKPKLQRLFDRFGKWYSLTIIALSSGFALFLPYLLSIPYLGVEGSVYRALTFLIAASPCALIIATPTAYLSAISSCARKGIILKGGAILDALASCSTIVFDKTGTLTTGKLTCVGIDPLFQTTYSKETALAIAAGLETHAVHPIADAVIKAAKEKSIRPELIENFTSVAGYGLKGIVHLNETSCPVFIGHPDFIKEQLSLEKKEAFEQILGGWKTQNTFLLIRQELFILHFEDEIRPESKIIIPKLKEQNFTLALLTGDHTENAAIVAKALEIPSVYANLRPEDKVKKVAELSSREKGVIMVGDGINDAPALTRSTVGISLGKIGSATAVDASDIVFLQDDITLLDWLLRKAHKTMHIVKENLVLALTVIVFATTPALLGYIPLWLAVILHEGGTVIVGLNSLRLLKK